jgi:small ligand-binding sensory domain FIST
MIKDKTGQDPNTPLSQKNIPPEFQALFRGDVHVAFPVTGSDTGDFLVRNIVGIDPDDGYMAVNHRMKHGDSMMFVRRDDQTVTADLSHTLVSLRKRVQAETGLFAPKGAVYISCVARALTEFSPGIRGGEMALVREIIGDIPLAGFYAGGEISAGRLYGYTGVLILFL